MATNQDACYDALLFRRFLDEQIGGQQEAEMSEHIGRCGKCQQKLAALAGQDESWTQLRTELADHSLAAPQIGESKVTPPNAGESHVVGIQLAGPERAEPAEGNYDETWGEPIVEDAEAENWARLLAPTDDPTKMGRLGSYEICGIIGRGSTGIVFKAFDTRLNRLVAIKMLAPGYSSNGSSRRRFEREGRSIAAVSDQHVIPIHGVDEFRGMPFIVMQYMPAGSLHQRLEQVGPMTTEQITRIGMQIACGLAAAHRQGIIHRDVKPANVLLEDGVERALVTDFGLARVADEATMTHSGAISGTPQYMSPEQAKGESLDYRSDLFSLGSVMYTACTGHSPFRSETVFGVIKRVCETEPRPIREVNPLIEAWLAAFIAKLQSKQPEHRFASAAEVAELLEQELAHFQSPTVVPTPARDWLPAQYASNSSGLTSRLVSGGVVLALLICMGLAGWMSRGGEQSPRANSNALPFAQDDLSDRSKRSSVSRALFFSEESRDATVPGFPGLIAELSEEQAGELADKARSHYLRSNYVKAEALCREALQLAPQLDSATFYLAASLHLQGKLNEAIPWHKKATKTKKFAGLAHYNLACAYALQQDVESALEQLTQARDSGYHDPRHMERDSDLDSLRNDQRFIQFMDDAFEDCQEDHEHVDCPNETYKIDVSEVSV